MHLFIDSGVVHSNAMQLVMVRSVIIRSLVSFGPFKIGVGQSVSGLSRTLGPFKIFVGRLVYGPETGSSLNAMQHAPGMITSTIKNLELFISEWRWIFL